MKTEQFTRKIYNDFVKHNLQLSFGIHHYFKSYLYKDDITLSVEFDTISKMMKIKLVQKELPNYILDLPTYLYIRYGEIIKISYLSNYDFHRETGSSLMDIYEDYICNTYSLFDCIYTKQNYMLLML